MKSIQERIAAVERKQSIVWHRHTQDQYAEARERFLALADRELIDLYSKLYHCPSAVEVTA
jgi:hypothetical protein